MSLLGYFWLLNSLSFLDGFVTVLGIETSIFYEANPIVNFFINHFGQNSGILIVKTGVLILTAIMFKLNQPGSNFIRNSFIFLIIFYGLLDVYSTVLILKAPAFM